MKTTHDTVVILDFGALNSQAAAKIVRSLKVYCGCCPTRHQPSESPR